MIKSLGHGCKEAKEQFESTPLKVGGQKKTSLKVRVEAPLYSEKTIFIENSQVRVEAKTILLHAELGFFFHLVKKELQLIQ